MSLVNEFSHLKGRPSEDKALPMLQRIASLVKPIMRNHSWTLPLLAEFFPDDPSLVGLNVNRGQKILLRLRPAHSPGSFYDEEDVLHTMLHELTHNVHGPHDARFYAFLDKLEDEYDHLKRNGYAGEGFHSTGKRLGVGVSHDVPAHQAKAKAAQAAEQRMTAQTMGKGGRLGGSSVGRNRSPRELAAEAAERRARDNKTCDVGGRAEEEAAKAARGGIKSSAADVGPPPFEPLSLQLDDRESSPEIVFLGERSARSAASNPPTKTAPLSRRAPPKPNTSEGHAASTQVSASKEWSCSACTLLNPPAAHLCTLCSSPRPSQLSDGWMCLFCGETGMDHQFWTCRSCGWVKKDSSAGA